MAHVAGSGTAAVTEALSRMPSMDAVAGNREGVSIQGCIVEDVDQVNLKRLRSRRTESAEVEAHIVAAASGGQETLGQNAA